MAGAYPKKGYLNEDFHVFYLTDEDQKTYAFHYHDFYKLYLFQRGNVSYHVEGKEYELRPGDVILLNPGEIHRPVIHDNTPYSRVVIYLSNSFFRPYQLKNGDSLSNCYVQAELKHSHLVRYSSEQLPLMNRLAKELASAAKEDDFASQLLQKVKIVEYLIHLNRWMKNSTRTFVPADTANPAVLGIIDFINQHLTEDLSMDRISGELFLNASYMMHLFKSETGYTIGHYITEKRLFLTNQFMLEGIPITEACLRSGFQSYHAFYHAYKKKYGKAPTK